MKKKITKIYEILDSFERHELIILTRNMTDTVLERPDFLQKKFEKSNYVFFCEQIVDIINALYYLREKIQGQDLDTQIAPANPEEGYHIRKLKLVPDENEGSYETYLCNHLGAKMEVYVRSSENDANDAYHLITVKLFTVTIRHLMELVFDISPMFTVTNNDEMKDNIQVTN